MECMSFLEFPCCCSFAKAETDLKIKVVFITLTDSADSARFKVQVCPAERSHHGK